MADGTTDILSPERARRGRKATSTVQLPAIEAAVGPVVVEETPAVIEAAAWGAEAPVAHAVEPSPLEQAAPRAEILPEAAPALAEPAAEPAPTATETSIKETLMLETNTAAGAAATKTVTDAMAGMGQVQDNMSAKAKDMMEHGMKSMTNATDFARGNVEAMVASAKAATAGTETIMTTVVEHGRKQFEAGSTAMRAMAAAKNPSELMQLQNDWLKGQFDHNVAMWSQLSETMLKVAGEVAQPLSSRMALATDQMKATMAR